MTDTPIVDAPIVDIPIVDTPILNKKTIGLSMIVKDESHVIKRVLESIYKHIDYWAIVDTGSTDGTQQIVKDFFAEKGIPGELIEMEWVDFSTCRNVSLQAVEKVTDYGIWIDADEEFIPMPTFNLQIALNTVDKDGNNFHTISVPTRYGGVDYTRKSIWKCGMGFNWSGPIHEILESPNEKTGGILHGAHVFVRAEGNSWKDVKAKYTAHAVILSKYTETNDDPRWVFYTAQSYRDASDHQNAFDWYKKRSEIVDRGFPEEVFFSKFMMARLAQIMKYDKKEVLALYNDAHKSDPMRGEAIKSLIQYLQECQDYEQMYVYSAYGLRYNGKNPYPNRILFLDNALYQFQMMELHAISCYYTGRREEGSKAYWQMRSQIKPGMLDEQATKIIMENEKHFLPLTTLTKQTPGAIPASQPTQRGSNYTPPKKNRKRR
jgi:glycosyltransferase involved in cell wall biosynthesis